MTEIRILSLKRNKNRFEVITDRGEYSFCEDTIVKYLIFKDKIFTDDEFSEILNAEKANVLLNKALNYLSYQYRSKQEIRAYLEGKAAAGEIEAIVERLTELGYLNDRALANTILEHACSLGKGPRYLEEKLTLRGIDEEIIRDTLNAYDEEKQEAVMLNVLEKYRRQYSKYPPLMQKKKLAEKLLRDGFSYDQIGDKINRLELQDDSEDSLREDFARLAVKYEELSDYERKRKIISHLMSKGYEYNRIRALLNIDE
jgi:regulatory protein